jgi:hypothetical protein
VQSNPSTLNEEVGTVTKDKGLLSAFAAEFRPVEKLDKLIELTDSKTGARYCECHIKGSKIVELGTTDVPLDPEEQPEYRANREIVTNDVAFQRMKSDARERRSFSNIVTEYTKEFDPEHPLKIIGGQHRFQAIREALASGVDEYHGVKVYFALDIKQRLDVQLISNTNIDTSGDLIDRLQESGQGPQLRDWCQAVGLLETDEDFADSFERGGPISVRMARTFITNYFDGKKTDPKKFATTDTTAVVCPSGRNDPQWDALKSNNPGLWSDLGLLDAAREFSALVKAQRDACKEGKGKTKPDFPEKARNMAILAAWAYVAGMLHSNAPRLKRHFDLRKATGKDPLNAPALAKGRHKSDPPNYRGLGYRTDPRERARFVELFFYQAEDGKGITPTAIELAIMKYEVKKAQLAVQRKEAEVAGKER